MSGSEPIRHFLIRMRAERIAGLAFGVRSVTDECDRISRAGDLIMRKWVACDIDFETYCQRKEALEIELDSLEIVVRGLRAIAERAATGLRLSPLVGDLVL